MQRLAATEASRVKEALYQTELIAPRRFAMGKPLGGAPFAAPETGTQGHVAELAGAQISEIVPNSVRGPFRCTPTEHRCIALALAFFDILADGSIGDLTRAAVASCNATLITEHQERKSDG